MDEGDRHCGKGQDGFGGSQEGGWVVWAAAAAGVAIAVSKYVAAAFTGSSAVLAEAVHSTVDVGNELLLLLGLHLSRRPPDRDHPFGHGHEVYFWSMLVAVLIFGVGGGVSFYEGLLRVRHPEPPGNPVWNYWVLGIAALFDGSSWVISVRELLARRRRFDPSLSLWQYIMATKDPTIPCVAFEDTADLLGLLLAFGGVFLGHRLGLDWIDGAASMAIGVVLAVVGAVLGFQCRGLLIGESAPRSIVDDVRRIANEDPDVGAVTEVLTMQLAPRQVLLAMGLRFRPQLPRGDVRAAIARVDREIRRRQPTICRVLLDAAELTSEPRDDLPHPSARRDAKF